MGWEMPQEMSVGGKCSEEVSKEEYLEGNVKMLSMNGIKET